VAELTHLDDTGNAHMVDVSGKEPTVRRAAAGGELVVGRDVMAAIRAGATPKGNVFETARLAGIMAAKRTAELIPLCHPLSLDHVAVDFTTTEDRVVIRVEAVTRASTGVEMEALTAAAVAGLTLYDMLKALSKTMVLGEVRLLAKTGGASGDYHAGGEAR
jgi:cyclic pyranopterin monophosphate synthase